MPIFYYHVIAFVVGFILDCIFGDPYFLPHPVRLIGKLISYFEEKYLGPKENATEANAEAEQEPEAVQEQDTEQEQEAVQEQDAEREQDLLEASAVESVLWEKMPEEKELDPWEEFNWDQAPVKKKTEPLQEEQTKWEKEAEPDKTQLTPIALEKRANGRTTVLLVLLCTVAATDAVLMGGYFVHPVLGCVIEAILTYQILAAKCLCVESMKVYKALKTGTIQDARKAVSMIVGRDTAKLDEEGVAKAAVETVAENTSDGVIAPMLYLAIGGPILGMAYKAINTMDSMIGYKNDRYLDFGRAAAKLDDVVNFVPSRISAWLMILACHVLGGQFIASEAKRIYLRDRRKHSSPNSAQTESACAGALGIQLAGDASYFGKVVHKPTIGDARRKVTPEDIPLSNHLMYGTTILCLLICLAILLAVCQFVFGGTAVIKFFK